MQRLIGCLTAMGLVVTATACAANAERSGDSDSSGGAGGGAGTVGSGGLPTGGTGGLPATPPSVSVLDAHPILADTQAEVLVRLSSTWGQPVSVEFTTVDGTAVAGPGADYTAVSQSVTIQPGQLQVAVPIDVQLPYRTLTLETALSRRFTTRIASPTGGAALGDAEGVVTLAHAGMVIETPLVSKLGEADIVPDFNGDQRPDLLLSGVSGAGMLLLTPGISFEEASHLVVDQAALNTVEVLSWVVDLTGTHISTDHVVGDDSAATDVNGDGLSDVLVMGERKAHFIYGNSAPMQNFTSGDPRLSDGVHGTHLADVYFGYGGQRVQTGDWNGDGVLDFGQSNAYSSAPGTGGYDGFRGYYGTSGGYGSSYSASASFSFRSGTTAVGQAGLYHGTSPGRRIDINGDGIEDLIFVGLAANDGLFGGNYMYTIIGDGVGPQGHDVQVHGTLTGSDGFEISNSRYMQYESDPTVTTFGPQDAGDVNGDGVEDLVLINGGNSLSVIFGRKQSFAKGAYSSIDEMGVEVALFTTDPVKSARIGDFNRDQIDDIAFITEDKLRVIWGKQGLQGREIVGTVYPEVGEIDIDPNAGLDTVAVVDDFDGDNTHDIVLLSSTWENNTGAALMLFGRTITKTLGGPTLDVEVPK